MFENCENENNSNEDIELLNIDEEYKTLAESLEKDKIKIEAENEELNRKYKELYENYLRTMADFENFKKRTKKESFKDYKCGQIDILKDILEIQDDFDRGKSFFINCKNEDEFLQGLDIIQNKIKNLLVSHNASSYGELGDDFDPRIHEAVASEPVEDSDYDGKIIRVLRKGFLKDDEVLRPAQVIVGRFENLSQEPAETDINCENK